jgi:PRTRC genetic system ThiF family protein
MALRHPAIDRSSGKSGLRSKSVAPVAPAPTLDLSLLHARPVKVGKLEHVHLCLVGCGGSGSWLAPAVARTARQLREHGVAVGVTFVDPDIVESANTFRQNFSEGEIGRSKAETLAMRFSAAWGLEIHARPELFRSSMVREDHASSLTVLLGCVDNAAGRRAMAEALDRGEGWSGGAETAPSRRWWLDCGNSRTSGQVLIGSTRKPERLLRAFYLPDRCSALPAPCLQHPELLTPKPEELGPGETGLSCAEMAARNAQSLTVNQMVAAIAADYLNGLVLSQSLTAFATYFDLAAKAMRSKYVTPEALAAFAIAPKKKGGWETRRRVTAPTSR